MGESFTTNTTCGAISSGTSISSEDTIQKLVKDMLFIPIPPNERYESINIGTWNSVNDVDTFFTLHNHNNDYKGLSLGNIITINDGTYNVDWEIAGFDCEHSRVANDNTTYDNGYGICLIPKTDLGVAMKWNNTNTIAGGYMSSNIHSSLVTVANNLKNILGSYLVLRNVLLSSSVGSSSYSNAYTWTTSYCTLMSWGQRSGTFGHNYNFFDDGEANYRLPLFNYEEYGTRNAIWSRGIAGYESSDNTYRVYIISSRATFPATVTNAYYVCPLIYLR